MFYLCKLKKKDGECLFYEVLTSLDSCNNLALPNHPYETTSSARTRAELQEECDSLNDQFEALCGPSNGATEGVLNSEDADKSLLSENHREDGTTARPYAIFEIDQGIWFRIKSYFMFLKLKLMGKI